MSIILTKNNFDEKLSICNVNILNYSILVMGVIDVFIVCLVCAMGASANWYVVLIFTSYKAYKNCAEDRDKTLTGVTEEMHNDFVHVLGELSYRILMLIALAVILVDRLLPTLRLYLCALLLIELLMSMFYVVFINN